ncbi:SSI family serine proteinase inhibitor [Streptomyces krungchingensis]|uniref:SSI family serine proteinase inhibitor n=1 Tax=Streptomyces krungchingensis TaxID=1565034 RepID=UPI003CE68591
MLHRIVLTAAASAAALSTAPAASAAVPAVPAVSAVSAVPAVASAPGPVSHGTPVHARPLLMPPPARDDDSGDRLTVTVHGSGGDTDGTYELRCHPSGGSHPDAAEACAELDRNTTWGKDPFAPVPPGTMCTMLYGGPATAHVTGTWAGRPVDARFDRTDGCEIARWDGLVPLLPSLGP